MLAGDTEIGRFVVDMSGITNFTALRCLQSVNGRFEIIWEQPARNHRRLTSRSYGMGRP